jgi:nicotinamidase-related amidase
MPGVIFWDVDTVADFILPGGRLYVPRGEGIIPSLGRLTRFAHERGITIVATADAHDPGDTEFGDPPDFVKLWPPHCLRGTPGQRKIPETALRDPLILEPEPQNPEEVARKVSGHRGDLLLHKRQFDVFTNANVDTVLRTLDPAAIVVYGLPLDVSGNYAVEGLLLHRPTARLYIVTDAVKAVRYELGEHLLKEWGEEGVRLVKTAEVVEDGVLGV